MTLMNPVVTPWLQALRTSNPKGTGKGSTDVEERHESISRRKAKDAPRSAEVDHTLEKLLKICEPSLSLVENNA